MFLRLAVIFFLATTTKAFLIEEECLNYTIYPVQYDIVLYPFVYNEQNSYYDCDVTITVICNSNNVQIIELDAKDLEIQGDKIKVLYGETDIVNKFRPSDYDRVGGKLHIYLREPLKPYSVSKAQYTIRLSFRKHVKTDKSGMFIVPYEDGGTKYLYTTRLSPNKAKYFFPCFDNPRFEAVFKFKVYEIPTKLGVQYTNTSLVIAKEQRRYDLPDHYIVKEYMPSPQVALYQVGFHHSQFGSRQVSAKNTNDTIIIWAPGSKLHNYDFILGFGERMLNFIIEYASVNRPLVYGPINIVSVPEILEGYEIGSWNLLTHGENKVAFIPQYSSIDQLEQMTYELAQQLARIWLGNPGELERTRWYEEWFKEGVATYLAHYFLTQYQHGVHTLRHKVPLGMYGLQMKHKAMSEDWHHSTPALINFNRTLAVEIPPRYKELVQMKTASLLWMVENWIGSDKFHAALVKYINTRRGHYISLRDFLNQMDIDTMECLHQFFNGSTSTKILNSWFHQPGYPVIQVNVLRDRKPDAIQLKQHKFSFTKETRDTSFLIPISYMVQNNHNCFNCYQPRFTIDQIYTFEENLNGGWILLNTNASGYYRVNYDLHTWQLIAKTLMEDRMSIPEQNRAQIVNDVFALYTAGEMQQELAIEILDYLDQETSPVVWDAAISGFELLKTLGASCNMNKYLYKDWQEFMRTKVSPIYSQVAGDIEQTSSNRMFKRNIVNFACSMGHQPCINSMLYMYEGYMRGKHGLDPDAREACYEIHYETDGNFEGRGFNIFEVEDKLAAERRIRKEKQFLYRIPMGVPEIGRLQVSSTMEPPSITEETVPQEQKNTSPDGAATNFVSSVCLSISFVLFLLAK